MDNKQKNIISKPKTQNRKSQTVNYEMIPSTEEIALVESMLVSNENDKKSVSVNENDIKEAIVYNNEYTSIDFMMPSDEREILEKNLNVYDDVKKMQEVLAIAKKNKKISEDIKTLELISKAGKLSNQLFDVMTDEDSIRVLIKAFKEKVEKGESGKAYKELATANKIMLDARQEMIKGLMAQRNGKSARIDLKFTNDNGNEFQLGVDI